MNIMIEDAEINLKYTKENIMENNNSDSQKLPTKIRVPRKHEFYFQKQEFMNGQSHEDFKNIFSQTCSNCENKSVDNPFIFTNCELDILVNTTVQNALNNVIKTELLKRKEVYESKEVNQDTTHTNEKSHETIKNINEKQYLENTSSKVCTEKRTISLGLEEHIPSDFKESVSLFPPEKNMISFNDTITMITEKDSFIKREKNIPLHVGVDLSSHYDNYEKCIGKGKFGVVYKVISRTNGKLAAAKEIKYNSKEVKKNIEIEIEILKYLSGNEFILELYEVFDCCHTKRKKMTLITEYLAGGDLFEQIAKDELLTETEIINIIRQILEGVSYIHKKHVIHRDLKPENIIYQSQETKRIKIIDFGFAVWYDEKNPPKSMVGTTIFVAPEVLGYESQSYKTDLWSIGVIAYDLLAGVTPFEIPNSGDLERQLTDAEIMENIERCQYNFEDEGFYGVSDEAKDFISSILIRQPEKRLTSEQCLRHPWLNPIPKERKMAIRRAVSVIRVKNYVALKKWEKLGMAIHSVYNFKNALTTD